MTTKKLIADVLDAYEIGLADGFFSGTDLGSRRYPDEEPDLYNPECKLAYSRGYDQGVYMYCKTTYEGQQ